MIRRIPLLLACLALLIPIPVLGEVEWITHGDSEYALTEVGGDWLACEAEAVALGAHLVALNDEAENTWIVDHFGNIPYWIGLWEPESDGVYAWSNGDSLIFDSWGGGQPDLLGSDHDYVAINLWASQIYVWHNTPVGGWPGGTPSLGIMERPVSTPAGDGVPRAITLAQNWPNPFNPHTEISFGLAAPARVSVVVYDVAGRELVALLDGVRLAEGRHRVHWNGEDVAGRAQPSGCYFYRLVTGSESLTRRMTLLR